MWYIYGLYAADAPEAVCYVGKTRDVTKRLRGHLYEAANKPERNTKKLAWIRATLRRGVSIRARVLASVEDGQDSQAERDWIARLQPRCNGTNGGDGFDSESSASANSLRWSASNARTRASKSMKEWHAEQRASGASRYTEESRRRMSEAQRKRSTDPATIEEFKHRMKSMWSDPDKRAAIIAAQTAAQNRDDVKDKIAEASRKRWEQWRADNYVTLSCPCGAEFQVPPSRAKTRKTCGCRTK